MAKENRDRDGRLEVGVHDVAMSSVDYRMAQGIELIIWFDEYVVLSMKNVAGACARSLAPAIDHCSVAC